MKITAIVERVVALSNAIGEYWDRVLPKPKSGFRIIRLDELAEVPSPPEREELRRFLMGLPPGTVFMLAYLMYLGRGDFTAEDDLLDGYVQMSKTFHKPGRAVEQMLGKALLGYYLSEGMKKFLTA